MHHRVQGVGFRFQDVECGVLGVGSRVYCLGFSAWGAALGGKCLGFWVYCLGLRVFRLRFRFKEKVCTLYVAQVIRGFPNA